MDSNLETPFRSIVVFECVGATTEGLDKAANGSGLRLDRSDFAMQTIRVPCSGKLQPEHLLKAFENGADLVVVLTCSDSDCRYLEGRQRIERRVDYVRGLLDDIGLGSQRLLLLDRHNHSASDGEWDPLAMVEGDLAPSPLGGNDQTKG
jgi:F420-non-reducing hydrogenase iron-sulfur subunit